MPRSFSLAAICRKVKTATQTQNGKPRITLCCNFGRLAHGNGPTKDKPLGYGSLTVVLEDHCCSRRNPTAVCPHTLSKVCCDGWSGRCRWHCDSNHPGRSQAGNLGAASSFARDERPVVNQTVSRGWAKIAVMQFVGGEYLIWPERQIRFVKLASVRHAG
jgi:hypothetical protein